VHVSSGRDADGCGADEFNAGRSIVAVSVHVLLEERQPVWPVLRLLPAQTPRCRSTCRVRVKATSSNSTRHVDIIIPTSVELLIWYYLLSVHLPHITHFVPVLFSTNSVIFRPTFIDSVGTRTHRVPLAEVSLAGTTTVTCCETRSVAAGFGRHGMPPAVSDPDLWPFDLTVN